MAELEQGGWTAGQTRAQFGAIAWLRWRILVNGFRRKGGAGELVGRVVLGMMFLGLLLAVVVGAGVGAFFLVMKGQMTWLAGLLWGIFIVCQLLNIQLGQPTTTFDPTQLIRFPLTVDTYVAIRLFFGLMSPANVAATLTSVAVWVGIGLAAPGLWLYALVAMVVFAATNVLFSRMVFAWVDRWLSTRRAREIFTGVILAGSLALQWANFTYNPAYHGHDGRHSSAVSQERVAWLGHVLQRAQPVLAVMPPELASTSLIKAKSGAVLGFAGFTLAAAMYGALFLLVFSLRMRTEFRGESLSDAASGAAKAKIKARAKAGVVPLRAPYRSEQSSSIGGSDARSGRDGGAVGSIDLSSSREAGAAAGMVQEQPFEVESKARILALAGAVVSKEILYVKRHTGVLYGLVMPIFLVLIFASRFSAGRAGATWVFPGAVAYALLAICPLSYNVFGLEGAGAQLYFLAPVRMRDVLLGKNLMGAGMALAEVALIFAIITYMAGMPSLSMTVAALLWAVGTLAINMIFGNQRSLASPKWMDPQKAMRRQSSQLSALIAMAVLVVSTGLAAGIVAACFWLHVMWLLVPVFAVFAAGGVFAYLQSLKTVDQFAREHREELLVELCKGAA